MDSQETVPYGSQELEDSQATQPYQQDSSQNTFQSSKIDLGDTSTFVGEPNSLANPGSPVFTSKKVSVVNHVTTSGSSHKYDSPITSLSSGPWISKETGGKIQDQANGKGTEQTKWVFGWLCLRYNNILKIKRCILNYFWWDQIKR